MQGRELGPGHSEELGAVGDEEVDGVQVAVQRGQVQRGLPLAVGDDGVSMALGRGGGGRREEGGGGEEGREGRVGGGRRGEKGTCTHSCM